MSVLNEINDLKMLELKDQFWTESYKANVASNIMLKIRNKVLD